MRYAKLVFLLFLSLFCVSCINSKWVMSIFYNRLDNRIYAEIKDYADFTDEQREEIRARVERFHHWHRTTQLPLYVDLINSIALEIQTNPNLSFDLFEQRATEFEQLVQKTNNCHPMMFSFDLMTGLTDTQVEQVREHMLNEYTEHRERYEKRTEEKRLARRKEITLTWMKRFKADLNQEELALMDESFASQIDLSEAGFSLWQNWDDYFYQLLLSRHLPEFKENTLRHIYYLESMLEDNYPEEVAHNRAIWRNFFYRVALDEAQSQQSEVPDFLYKLAGNVAEIAEDVPKSQLEWNALDYCSA